MMKKILKWLGFVVAGLVVVVLAVGAYVFIASSRELTATHPVMGVAPLAIPTDANEIEEGRRLKTLVACMHCHDETLGGQLVHDFPSLARFVRSRALRSKRVQDRSACDRGNAADPLSHGKYFAMNLYTECHAQNLEGKPMAKSAMPAYLQSRG